MPLLALSARQEPMNLLLITVDDMSCDSVGVYGSKLEGTTPVMDRLAAQSLRFEHAPSPSNCNPCRNVMFSGLISHNNKVEGFYKVPDPGWPHMVDLLKDAGYYTGIHGKVTHSSPYQPYAWDDDLTISPSGERAHIKDAKAYGASTSRGIEKAKKAGKPSFCRSTYRIRISPSGHRFGVGVRILTSRAEFFPPKRCRYPVFFLKIRRCGRNWPFITAA